MTEERAPEAVLTVHGLTAGYDRTTVIRDLSFTVEPATAVAVLGLNGAGKTTLLRALAGELRPSSGKVTFDGKDITNWNSARRASAGLAHVPEGRGVFRSLTVRENLRLFSMVASDDAAVERALSAFPVLEKRMDQRAGSMSGGEQQMLAMAAAYCRSVKLVMVDEASLGLAPIVVDEVFSFLADLAASGTALLVVDQFAERVLKIATKVCVMQRGIFVFEGPVADLNADVFEYYLGSDGSVTGAVS